MAKGKPKKFEPTIRIDVSRHREHIADKGSLQLEIVSGSMVPLISIGEKVDVELCTLGDLRRFDVIVFKQQEVLICHFVWDLDPVLDLSGMRYVLTRPLSHSNFDLPALEEEIVGRVVGKQLSKSQKAKVILQELFRALRRK